MVKYALFDMDGTLLDSMGDWCTVLYDYIKAQNYDFISEEQLNSLMDKPAFTYIAALGREHGFVFDEAEAFRGVLHLMMQHYREDVTVKGGVRELLEDFRSAGIHMCLITATPHKEAGEALALHRLDGYFEFILTSEDCPGGKHNPAIFQMALDRLGAKPEEAVLFDDALYSLETAAAAGIRVIGIEDPTQAKNREKISALTERYLADFTGFDHTLL